MSFKVIHICQNYLGLSETFIYQIIKNHNKWQPVVITNKIQNFEKFPIKSIVSTEFIRKYSFWWFRNHLDYYLSKEDNYVDYISYLKYQIRKNHGKIIHAHFGPAGYKMLPIKKSLKIPLITTFYGYDMSQLPKKKQWQNKYQILFDEGDIFLVEGPYMKKKLEEIGCPEEKIKIQKISINLGKIPYKERKIKKDEKIRLLFCGRFVEKKGLIYALKAFKEVVRQITNIEFRIIGDGELRQQIIDYINNNNLGNHVHLLGYKEYSHMLNEIENCHILIQPSITSRNGDSEGGAPTILLEAQASGLPIISTNNADIPFVISENKSGFLVPEKNTEALTEKLIYLIKNPKLWPIMGKNGRDFVSKNHNIIKEIDTLESYYNSLI